MRHLPFVGFSDFAHWQLSRDLGLEKDATCVTAARLREAAKKVRDCWRVVGWKEMKRHD